MTRAPKPTKVYIGIGSNLDEPAEQVRRALIALQALPHTALEKSSALFRTAPIDAEGDDFINAVALLQTQLSPLALLQALQQIEADFGRQRPFVNAPRTLDLDILLYGPQRLHTPELIIPHPRLTQRAFALIPLLQVDPFVSIPGQGPAHAFVPDVAAQVIEKVAD